MTILTNRTSRATVGLVSSTAAVLLLLTMTLPTVFSFFVAPSPTRTGFKLGYTSGLEEKYYNLQELEDRDTCTTEIRLNADRTVRVGATDGPMYVAAAGEWRLENGQFSMIIARKYSAGSGGTDMGEFSFDVERTFVGPYFDAVGASTRTAVSGSVHDFTRGDVEVGFFNLIDTTAERLGLKEDEGPVGGAFDQVPPQADRMAAPLNYELGGPATPPPRGEPAYGGGYGEMGRPYDNPQQQYDKGMGGGAGTPYQPPYNDPGNSNFNVQPDPYRAAPPVGTGSGYQNFGNTNPSGSNNSPYQSYGTGSATSNTQKDDPYQSYGSNNVNGAGTNGDDYQSYGTSPNGASVGSSYQGYSNSNSAQPSQDAYGRSTGGNSPSSQSYGSGNAAADSYQQAYGGSTYGSSRGSTNPSSYGDAYGNNPNSASSDGTNSASSSPYQSYGNTYDNNPNGAVNGDSSYGQTGGNAWGNAQGQSYSGTAQDGFGGYDTYGTTDNYAAENAGTSGINGDMSPYEAYRQSLGEQPGAGGTNQQHPGTDQDQNGGRNDWDAYYGGNSSYQ